MDQMKIESLIDDAMEAMPIFMAEYGPEVVTLYMQSDSWEASMVVTREGITVVPKLGVVTTYCQATLYESWLAGARQLGEEIRAVLLEDDQVELAPLDAEQLRAWIDERLDRAAQPGLLPVRRLDAREQAQEDALAALAAAARES